ncbi:tetratricopeptide repeat protein [Pedobacter paludis]|uniref:Uncharacterized protein n=1 Tax=Pedobacter paludis TaxID=2203212 RepID=A0A317EWN1_9SPHI|nr:tetratricopeptide repeat protein [Pedobacter paludis]PWS30862.1 hypothetical protein DF947_14725 [Pedobacter paludis]
MKNILLSTFFAVLITQFAYAQKQDIKDLYFDYLQVRMDADEKPEAKTKAIALLQRSSELTKTQLGNVNYHLGRLYEEDGEIEKAVPYYEESIKITPGYYVPYRALGFMYYKKCAELGKKLIEIDKSVNGNSYKKAFDELKALSLKTAKYLEKSQACDPDDETLDMIKVLYKNLKDDKALTTIKDRLKALSADCVTLLED